MWILNFLPDWFFTFTLVIGILGLIATFFLKFLPPVYMYRMPIQLISGLVIAVSTYMMGAVANNNEWKQRVAELEKQVESAKAESQKVTTEVVTQFVTKREVVKEKGQNIITYVDREVVKYNNECKLPPDVIKIHNDATRLSTVK
jgi:uncharacterized membrane protein